MRKFSVIILIMIFVTTACVPHVELYQRIIVQSVGIDSEDEKYTVSIQYSDNRSGSNDTTDIKLYKEKGTGINLSTAASEIEEKLGEKLFFSQAQVIVFGKGAMSQMDYIIRSYTKSLDRHPAARIAGTEGKAEDIMYAKSDYSPMSGNKVLALLTNASAKNVNVSSELYELNNHLSKNMNHKSGGFAFIPILKLEGEKDEKNVELDGGAIVGTNEIVSKTNGDAVAGISIILSGNKQTNVTAKVNDQFETGYVFGGHLKIIPRMIEGKTRFEVSFRGSLKRGVPHIDRITLEDKTEFEKIMSERLANLLRTAFAEVQKNNTDILYLSEILRHHGIKTDVDFRDAVFNVNVKLNLERFQ